MKKYKVIWDDQAIIDLRKIIEYLQENAPEVTLKVRNELVRISRSLNTLPQRYRQYEYIDKSEGEYRRVVRWSYRIIYEVLENEVYITRIVHTSRDPSSIKV